MHGMVIRNLTFKGERLAYEISFQEFFASYSGMGGPGQTVYFDSNWEITLVLIDLWEICDLAAGLGDRIFSPLNNSRL